MNLRRVLGIKMNCEIVKVYLQLSAWKELDQIHLRYQANSVLQTV